MPFVLDASVAVAWCFEDETTVYTDHVQGLLTADTAVVPAIWALEVGNALRFAEQRQRLTGADVLRFVEMISALPITPENALVSRDLGPVLSLARAHDLSSYDASYLELAARQAMPLATQDRRLRAVAERMGIPLVV